MDIELTEKQIEEKRDAAITRALGTPPRPTKSIKGKARVKKDAAAKATSSPTKTAKS